jgi:hypothetical protein
MPVKERTEVIRRVALEPEKPVEEVIAEVEEAPFVLQFAATSKEPLVEGRKTQTSMTSIPDPKIKAGAIVYAAIWEPRIVDLRITSVERKRLKYFDEDDAKREGGYTLEQFKRIWKEEHGEWDEDQLVYVVHFEKTR